MTARSRIKSLRTAPAPVILRLFIGRSNNFTSFAESAEPDRNRHSATSFLVADHVPPAQPGVARDGQLEDEAVMAIDQLVRPLLGVELFQGLKPLQITEIARRADRIVFRPGDVIVAEDTTGDAAILIVAGEAARVSGPGLGGDVEPVQPGSLVGEMAMLVDTIHSSTVVARSAVRALKISRSELLEQMEADPALAEHFVARISGRLSRLAADLRAIDCALDQTALDMDAARQSGRTFH